MDPQQPPIAHSPVAITHVEERGKDFQQVLLVLDIRDILSRGLRMNPNHVDQ